MVTVLSLPSMGSFKEGSFKGFFSVQKWLLGIHVILAKLVAQCPGIHSLTPSKDLVLLVLGSNGAQVSAFCNLFYSLGFRGNPAFFEVRYYPFFRFERHLHEA